MMGKTHILLGNTLALLISESTSNSICLAIAIMGGALGGIMPNIDTKTKCKKK